MNEQEIAGLIADYEKQAEKFLADNQITFKAILSNTKTAAWSDGKDNGNHFKITLKGHGRHVSFDFWDSIADKKAGIETCSPYDVLACISGDINCPDTFEDFCAEYDYDTDSIKALAQFKLCNKFAKKLQAFFTGAEREQLAEIQ